MTAPLRVALTVVIPVYNDWESVTQVVARLRTALADHVSDLHIVLIDDGGEQPPPPELLADGLSIIKLRRNLGHQRALCVGLCWVREHLRPEAVLVMDGDGEDAPEDVPRLLERFVSHGRKQVIFAARARRSEGFLFRALYNTYRAVHLLLTGIRVRVGNFSILPSERLERLCVSSELWNHYAASVVKGRLPMDTVPIDRARRIAGRSSMDLMSLVLHGLSAISVFAETVVVRLLVGISAFTALILVTLLVAVGVRVFTSLAIPGWATTSVGILLVLLVQAVGISLVLVMGMLGARQSASFLPMRDYAFFIERVD
jgi:glycosyltransferase involved in cell wall biosynthesis